MVQCLIKKRGAAFAQGSLEPSEVQAVPSGLALGCLLHLLPHPSGSTCEDTRSACHIAAPVLPAQLNVDDAACSLLGRAAAHPLPILAAIAIAVHSPVRMHAGAHPAPVGQRWGNAQGGSQSLPLQPVAARCAACRCATDLGRAARARRRSAAAAWPPTASWPATSVPPAPPRLQRRP